MAIVAKTIPLRIGLLVLHFLTLAKLSNCQTIHFAEKACGILYSEEVLSGDEYSLNSNDQSVNLGDDSLAWNATRSISIEPGCTMDICNETYFDGSCQSLEQGSFPNLTTLGEFSGSIASVSCTCPKECKCSDIFMKKSSCARAYLKGGCKSCHALYTDLIGSKKSFPETFVGKVEAFKLRKGCTLTLYSEEDYDGDEELFDTETVEEYRGEFRSYECECNDDDYESRVIPPRSPSLPQLIDIPSSVDDIIKLLKDKNFSNHLGLQSALKSVKNGRSSKNAYILLLGSTGSGKSSAINLLFDNPNITRVGDAKSTTTDIHEFRIPVPVDELGIANSELRIIDTPGLGDTRGLTQDAKFLATLDAFLANHEELKDRLPNVVLVFHKFHDNRFDGEGAAFVKMVRGLDSFRSRIMDENYSNVIFVLSHFCSVTKEVQRKPDERINGFKNVIENCSLFPRPTIITVAENKAKEQELPMVNGFFKLPNNDYYPRNLFEKLELVTERGGDPVGLGVFRTAFRDSEDFNISSNTFHLLSNRGPKVDQYLRILANAFFGVINTEISQLLQRVWDEKVNATSQQRFPNSLQYLQKSLNIRNINTKEDIPRTTVTVLELLTAIKLDEVTRILLEQGLDIKAPSFPQNPIAGHGYNVFKDMYLPVSPYELGELQQSEIGYLIPKAISCKAEPSTRQNFLVFDDKEKYVQHRLRSLGIEGNIAEESFKGSIKPGHNINSISFTNESCTLSATKEIRLFEFTLNDRPALTKEFVETVKSLPVFNEEDHETFVKWNAFFNDYGTHIVRSVYGGGAIQIQVQSEKEFCHNLGPALFNLIRLAEYNSYLTADYGNETASASNGTVFNERGISHSLMCQGGGIQYTTSDFSKMPIEDATKLLSSWKKSLRFSPAVLATEMKLVPMSQVVKKLGQNYTSEIERATSLLFNSSLKYVPKKRSTAELSPGLARDDTPLMNQMALEQEKFNQRMTELMMEIKRIEAQNEERRQIFEQQTKKWQMEQAQIQRDYEMNKEKAEREAEAERRKLAAEAEQARLAREAKRDEEDRKWRAEQERRQQEYQQQQLAVQKETEATKLRMIAEQEKARIERENQRAEERRKWELKQEQLQKETERKRLQAEKEAERRYREEIRRNQEDADERHERHQQEMRMNQEAAARRNADVIKQMLYRPPPVPQAEPKSSCIPWLSITCLGDIFSDIFG